MVEERGAETSILAHAAQLHDLAAERRIHQLRDRHQTMLWGALFVMTAAMLLQVRGTGAVSLPWPFDAGLPVLCSSRALFGIECPGCGLTRSFVALAAGDFEQSLGFHRVGWLLALAVVLQVPYRIIALRELRTRVIERTWPTWCGYILIAALIVNWLLKMAGL